MRHHSDFVTLMMHHNTTLFDLVGNSIVSGLIVALLPLFTLHQLHAPLDSLLRLLLFRGDVEARLELVST
jgi:hypothetical protein